MLRMIGTALLATTALAEFATAATADVFPPPPPPLPLPAPLPPFFFACPFPFGGAVGLPFPFALFTSNNCGTTEKRTGSGQPSTSWAASWIGALK
jgi:hypothetical protein